MTFSPEFLVSDSSFAVNGFKKNIQFVLIKPKENKTCHLHAASD